MVRAGSHPHRTWSLIAQGMARQEAQAAYGAPWRFRKHWRKTLATARDRRDLAQSHLQATELLVTRVGGKEAEKICRLAVESHATLSPIFQTSQCFARTSQIATPAPRDPAAARPVTGRRTGFVSVRGILKKSWRLSPVERISRPTRPAGSSPPNPRACGIRSGREICWRIKDDGEAVGLSRAIELVRGSGWVWLPHAPCN